MASTLIVVLNDGETYSEVAGCEVRWLNNVGDDDSPIDAPASLYFNLTNPIHLRMLADCIERERR